jgi:hypothetical protein
MLRAASSYASQSEMVLTFGLGVSPGRNSQAVDVEVAWPGGGTEIYRSLPTRRLHLLEQQR